MVAIIFLEVIFFGWMVDCHLWQSGVPGSVANLKQEYIQRAKENIRDNTFTIKIEIRGVEFSPSS